MTYTNRSEAGRKSYYNPKIRIESIGERNGCKLYKIKWLIPNPKYPTRHLKKTHVDATLIRKVNLEFVSESSAHEWMHFKMRELRRKYGAIMKPEKQAKT